MTSTFPKRKDLTLTSKLTELGFTEIYSLGKMLILCTKTEDIHCKLDNNDLTKTTEKYLKSSLDRFTKFTVEEKEIICTHVCKMLLDSIKQQSSQEQQEKQRKQNETQIILSEINLLREQNANLTFEEWQSTLQAKYQELYNTIHDTMPEIWPGLEFELSILRILSIEDCNLPFIGIILGRPSSYKTVIISLLKEWRHKTFYTDSFTAKSFVSHSTVVESEEELMQIDLLPKVKDELFLTPELSPLFTTNEDDLTQVLGIITRIADGQGYSSDSGAHGHRGYDGEFMFTWIGAAVDIPYKVYKILHSLGPRMYFFRMKFEEQTSEELLKYAIEDQQFTTKLLRVKSALFDYLKWFEIDPMMNPNTKVKWEFDSDSIEALKYNSGMSDLLSYLRCPAVVWETSDTQGSEYAYTISQREKPTRTISHLKNLARGHALLSGRNHITLDDIPMIIKTGLDTATIERVSMFNLLIANNGAITTDQITESLKVAKKTALKTMTEFKAIGLVDIEDTQGIRPGRPSKKMVLDSRFNWFLKDELITKIIPHTPHNFSYKSENENGNGNGNGNGEGHKVDVEKMWSLYDELEREEQQDPANYTVADKNTVNRKKLHDKLVESGYFSNLVADQTIDVMIHSGRLEQVMMDTLRRR